MEKADVKLDVDWLETVDGIVDREENCKHSHKWL